ncbi:MAG TPA: outer membrane protein [Hyphomicrobiaceae bacterium]|nr:outer membrane protein [Hyphomicrobiaceae bacterium]
MRNCVLGACSALALGAATLVAPAAADGPNSWGGFYIGAHAGYGWGDWNGPLSYDDHDPTWPQPQFAFDGSDKSISGDNWLGGLQIGANYQTGSVVLGIEADVSWTDVSGFGSFLPYPNNPGSPAWDINTKLDLFGTLRGRVGYASGPLLLYATGGLAWGTTQSDITPNYGVAPTNNASYDTTHVGYAVGGGVEWMLARNWTLKAEYLFADLGKEDYAYDDGAGYDTDHYHADLQLHSLRMGLNYKF